ncbi:hypothetical protein DPMN_058522 [Dreissena polymorpha]|uniref:Apple domain-containing protein n=1 Tax=Dreissena polymorpha TaxID=45954 RepID=A0A9D4C270_DREPO|nr:hypothetical protein DPMN_058522 [Dreissena polymorpha]
MARLLRTLLLCVCATASQVWTLEYKSSWFGPPMGDNIPRVIQVQKSLTECLNACALRPWCKVVGYHRYGMCAIFFDIISSAVEQCNNGDCQEQDQRIIYVERED